MLHILLVEDDVDLATTIVEYLALENMHCDYARTGAHGLQLAGAPACGTAYDAIVLDLNLPLLDGLSLCARLRQEGDDTPVLMLTARGHIDDKLAGFAAGTDDYLIKPFEMRELVARLQALSQRRSGQARILRCGDLLMDVREHRVERQGRLIQLSPIGWRILHVLLRQSPEAVSRQKLLFEVWGDDPPDSDSLKVHLFHLRKSIDAPFDTNLLHTMPGHGVALREGTS
ncbi:XRE family transcriptional regulator [Desulfovibrio fairfieldensis]|uniref:XRE family transcriptional regulator n=1 Tax=Desulfovibrio fairfieldensis TaxID=44742 RepID=A0A0X8JJ00_9BACT|nr:response regulator transcription factor [Desulfovibrio fairfieldensis]AMD89537.1 XRE family transcriptional regulator [Desulfovibrio fairfieldensis]